MNKTPEKAMVRSSRKTMETAKRTVDYERIIKELVSAKMFMDRHWHGTKMNLRKWCEDADMNGSGGELEYIRMINHTFPLKKAENNNACQKILDEKIADLKAKKEKKDAPPQPKQKRTATVAVCHSTVKPEDYMKVRKHQNIMRTNIWQRYRKMGDMFAALQKAVEEAGVKDQVLEKAGELPVMRRILHASLQKPKDIPEITNNEEMIADVKKMSELYDLLIANEPQQ